MKENVLLIINPQRYYIERNLICIEILSRINTLIESNIFKYIITSLTVPSKDSPLVRFCGKPQYYKSSDIEELTFNRNSTAKIITDDLSLDLRKVMKNFSLPLGDNAVFICGFDTETSVIASAIEVINCGLRPIILEDYVCSSNGMLSHEVGLFCLRNIVGNNNMLKGQIRSSKGLSIIKRLS